MCCVVARARTHWHPTGLELRLHELHLIDVSMMKPEQLIASSDPRPTSDAVNTQLHKIMTVLGMVAQRVGLSNAAIENAIGPSVHDLTRHE